MSNWAVILLVVLLAASQQRDWGKKCRNDYLLADVGFGYLTTNNGDRLRAC